MSETITRQQLFECMCAGNDPALLRPTFDSALDRLGWRDRQDFGRTDLLELVQTIPLVMTESLLASTDPSERKLGEGLQTMMEAVTPLEIVTVGG